MIWRFRLVIGVVNFILNLWKMVNDAYTFDGFKDLVICLLVFLLIFVFILYFFL